MVRNEVLATLMLLLSTAAGCFLLNNLVDGAAAMADPQFFNYFVRILIGITVAWFASAVVVFLRDGLTPKTVGTCVLISAIFLAFAVHSAHQGYSHRIPKFFNRAGHLTWGCGSGSSYACIDRGVELCCYNSDCDMLPTMPIINFSVVCL